MRVATTAAGSFNYFYDAQNRRVRKQYPNGDMDGYFWGEGKALCNRPAKGVLVATTQVIA